MGMQLLTENGKRNKAPITRALRLNGLTEAALRAARAIKFTPAQKNGKTVSIYM
jgi:hypothetical protein